MAITYYSNTAIQTTLSGSISSGATAITVGATTGFPTSFPYTLALDYGSGTEELVSVTAAASLNLTVTRGFSGTSAQSHSLGAVVRHVYHAGDATDFRTHEGSAAGVHGLTGTVVGTSDTQTLANKTLTAPTITNGAMTGGGSMAGTFTGAPVFTGGPTFTTLSALWERALATDSAIRTRLTGDTNSRLLITADGKMAWGSGTATGDTNLYREGADQLTTDDTLRVYRPTVSGDAFQARVTGDTVSRFNVDADGAIAWGPGGAAAQDTNLFRSAAGMLKTDTSLTVAGDLSVTGIGSTLFARKAAATTRTNTITRTDDPDLTVTVAANATYELSGLLVYQSASLNGDIILAPNSPAGAVGWWATYAPSTSATSEPSTLRPLANLLSDPRTYGAGFSAANGGMILSGLIRTAAAGGAFAFEWAQATADVTGTTLQADSFICLRRVA